MPCARYCSFGLCVPGSRTAFRGIARLSSRADRRGVGVAARGDGARAASSARPAAKELIAAFEQQAANVQVEFIPVGNQGEHMTKLPTGFSGGNPPGPVF